MQSQINPDAPVKEYTGVWIPAEVMECEQLSPMEKILYGEIAGFRECYASNAWLANRIGRTERSVQMMLAKLIKIGFVEKCGFNGRFRLIRVRNNFQVRHEKNFTPAMKKISPITKSIDKSINIDKSIDDKSSESKEYGNKDVNELMRYWQERIGSKPSQNPANRRACSTLIRQKGVSGARDIVDLIHSAQISLEPYAPMVASFAELYGAFGKLSKLEAFKTRLDAKNATQRKLSTFYRNSAPVYDEPTDEDRAKTSQAMKEAREKLFGDK